jgi:hypothetical protein
MENVGTFYDPLKYFTAIWYNLWPFGIICGHLVHFHVLVCLSREKSGNPDVSSCFSFFHTYLDCQRKMAQIADLCGIWIVCAGSHEVIPFQLNDKSVRSVLRVLSQNLWSTCCKKIDFCSLEMQTRSRAHMSVSCRSTKCKQSSRQSGQWQWVDI